MRLIGSAIAVLFVSVLLTGADKPRAPAMNYGGLEDLLRSATAHNKVGQSDGFTLGNFAAPDNPQVVEMKLIPITTGSSINYVRVRSSLGAERLLFAVPGNLSRAYFSGAAVMSQGGGPWSSFATGVSPPVYPQSVRPDMAIGPPPELASKQIPTWDIIPFNVRSGDQVPMFEYFNVDEKCGAGGYSLEIVERPFHGTLNVAEGKFFAPELVTEAFHAKRGDDVDSRARCRLTSFPAGLILYAPTPGYVGRDTATVMIRDRGYESVEHFVLRVLPRSN